MENFKTFLPQTAVGIFLQQELTPYIGKFAHFVIADPQSGLSSNKDTTICNVSQYGIVTFLDGSTVKGYHIRSISKPSKPLQ